MNQEEFIKGKLILSCYNGFNVLVPTVGFGVDQYGLCKLFILRAVTFYVCY